MCKFCESRTMWQFLGLSKEEYLKNIYPKTFTTCVKKGCSNPAERDSCLCREHNLAFHKWFMELATDESEEKTEAKKCQ